MYSTSVKDEIRVNVERCGINIQNVSTTHNSIHHKIIYTQKNVLKVETIK